MERVASFLKRKLVEPLTAQLTQGVTPGRLALALALGAVLGVIPVLGVSTILSAIAAAALRLNQPAIQVANYAAAPLQLALLIPFFQVGAALLGAPPVTFTLGALQAELAADAWGTVARYAGANARAVAAWALLAPPAAAALHFTFRAVLSRLPRPAPAPGEP